MKIACIFGHKWLTDGVLLVGATMGWDGLPARSYRQQHRCDRCGKQKTGPASVIAHERALWPHYYDKDGWPLSDEGKRLPIDDGGQS